MTTINQSKLVSNSNYNIHDDYTWLKNDAKITLLLPKAMSVPIQGYLLQQKDNSWYCKPDRSRKSSTKIIELHDLHNNEKELIILKNIHRVWIQSKTVISQQELAIALQYHARRAKLLSTNDPLQMSPIFVSEKLSFDFENCKHF